MSNTNKIKLLWRRGVYDGMTSAIGEYDNKKVYIVVAPNYFGGWEKKEEWRKLDEIFSKIMCENSFDRYVDFIDENYDEEVFYDSPRKYNVYYINDETYKECERDLKLFNLHIGMNINYVYKNGKVSTPHNMVWGFSNEYNRLHYYNVNRKKIDVNEQFELLDFLVDWNDLITYNDFTFDIKDPRTEELKEYQKNWKPGDPVRIFEELIV